jgi:hypothetical protein
MMSPRHKLGAEPIVPEPNDPSNVSKTIAISGIVAGTIAKGVLARFEAGPLLLVTAPPSWT